MTKWELNIGIKIDNIIHSDKLLSYEKRQAIRSLLKREIKKAIKQSWAGSYNYGGSYMEAFKDRGIKIK